MEKSLLSAVSVSDATIADLDVLRHVPWLAFKIFGNSLHDYILTALSFVILWGGLYAVRKYFLLRIDRRARKEDHDLLSFCHGLLYEIRPYVFPMLAFYAATKRLSMPGSLEKGLHLITVAIILIQVIRLASELLTYLIIHSRSNGTSADAATKTTNNNITSLLKIGLWTAGIMFFLDNAGFNVSTFIAGLGIGGVAIALAAQAVLGDTFSSFAISLDKPFEVGDFINVDNLQGVVEHIGLKTTRVRSVGGELLVFANSDLTKSRIRNFKRMRQRRASFKINVHPATPLDKVRAIPGILAKVVEAQEETVLDRANFAQFGDSSLIFEVVYNVKKPDYKLYVGIQQAINLAIGEAFAKERIQMAFTPLASEPASQD